MFRCGRTDVRTDERTDRRTFLPGSLGHLSGEDLIKWTAVYFVNWWRRRNHCFRPWWMSYCAELWSWWDKFIPDESSGGDRHSFVITDMAWQQWRKCCRMVPRQDCSNRSAAKTMVNVIYHSLLGTGSSSINGDRLCLRKLLIFDASQIRPPLTDRQKIHLQQLPQNQTWCKSAHVWLLGKCVKHTHTIALREI